MPTRGESKKVQRFLEKGADPNGADKGCMTWLQNAVVHGNDEMVRLLLEHGQSHEGSY